jgi:predicted DNA-binding protein (MmcQ/YjbR family)
MDLATSRPEQFFTPPYVAHLGWIGVRLDRDLGWDEIERVIKDAYEVVAQKMSSPRHLATRAPSAKARRST